MTHLRGSAIVVLIAGLLLFCAAGPAAAEANINFLLGAKYLDEDDWEDANSQGAFGIQTTFGPQRLAGGDRHRCLR